MRALRQSMIELDPKGSAEHFGWQLSNEARHCNWDGVTCNQAGRIVALALVFSDPLKDNITASQDLAASPSAPGSATPNGTASPWNASSGGSGSQGASPWGPLLPELAWLQLLEQLDMIRIINAKEMLAGIPPKWGLPGAFPALKRYVALC